MSDQDPADLRSRFQALDLSGLPKENVYLKKLKRWLFRRGVMPDGDASEMLERVRGRFPEALEPMKRMMPPATTTLLGDVMSEEDKARYEARRQEANKKIQEESLKLFGNLIKEEGESQWSRIIDRRARDNFYSIFIGLIVGYLIGNSSRNLEADSAKGIKVCSAPSGSVRRSESVSRWCHYRGRIEMSKPKRLVRAQGKIAEDGLLELKLTDDAGKGHWFSGNERIMSEVLTVILNLAREAAKKAKKQNPDQQLEPDFYLDLGVPTDLRVGLGRTPTEMILMFWFGRLKFGIPLPTAPAARLASSIAAIFPPSQPGQQKH